MIRRFGRVGALRWTQYEPDTGAWELRVDGVAEPVWNTEIRRVDDGAACAWATAAICDVPVPFYNRVTGARPGFVAGLCGHAVAGVEWRAGFRVCEHGCPDPRETVRDTTNRSKPVAG